MLFGTEQNHLELRVRTIVELAKYVQFFLLKEGLPSSFSLEGVVKLPNCWVTLSSSLPKNILNNQLKIESLSV